MTSPESPALTSALHELVSGLPSAHTLAPKKVLGTAGDLLRLHPRKNEYESGKSHAGATPPLSPDCIRFIFFTHTDDIESVERYHDALVTVESLLDRVFNAYSVGLRPVHGGMGLRQHAQVFTRPPRGLFQTHDAEYRRWFDRHGLARDLPLNLVELVDEIVACDNVTGAMAQLLASRHSWALRPADQAWVIQRSQMVVSHRPLHREDLAELSGALETIARGWNVGSLGLDVVKANVDIAVRAAEILGALLDEYTPTPFAMPKLAGAYAEAHAEHLGAISSLDCGRTLSSPLSEPDVRPWFDSKRQLIRAIVARNYHGKLTDVTGTIRYVLPPRSASHRG